MKGLIKVMKMTNFIMLELTEEQKRLEKSMGKEYSPEFRDEILKMHAERMFAGGQIWTM